MNSSGLIPSQVCEIQISYKPSFKQVDLPQITHSSDVYRLVSPLWKDVCYRERFAIVLLNRANKVLGINWTSLGGVSGTVVDLKIIYQAALKANACGIILMHNHPSGNLMPSTADRDITKKVKEAGNLLDIKVLDHVIITEGGFTSFSDEGWL